MTTDDIDFGYAREAPLPEPANPRGRPPVEGERLDAHLSIRVPQSLLADLVALRVASGETPVDGTYNLGVNTAARRILRAGVTRELALARQRRA